MSKKRYFEEKKSSFLCKIKNLLFNFTDPLNTFHVQWVKSKMYTTLQQAEKEKLNT